MSTFDSSARDERIDRILSEVRGKRVVHLGCADSPFTRERLQNRTLLHLRLLEEAEEVIGVDVDDAALSILQDHCPANSLFSPSTVPSHDTFAADVVVAGEIIEHIFDFPSFAGLLDRVCGPDTVLLVTTPNAYSLKGSLRALAGVEEQHQDHKCLFSPKTLDVMMRSLGFELASLSYYNNRPRRLVAALPGYLINGLLRLAPRGSDGLYCKFVKAPL